jgi:hypothetical protein
MDFGRGVDRDADVAARAASAPEAHIRHQNPNPYASILHQNRLANPSR